MIRTILTPHQQHISLQVPESFLGQQVEVIAFTREDLTQARPVLDEPWTHLASESVLAKEWLTPQEDQAWQDL